MDQNVVRPVMPQVKRCRSKALDQSSRGFWYFEHLNLAYRAAQMKSLTQVDGFYHTFCSIPILSTFFIHRTLFQKKTWAKCFGSHCMEERFKFLEPHYEPLIDGNDLSQPYCESIWEVPACAHAADKHQYLLPTSNHPPHVHRHLPYGLAIRLRQIVSVDERFIMRLEELKSFLLARGYSYQSTDIDRQFAKAIRVPRSIALQTACELKNLALDFLKFAFEIKLCWKTRPHVILAHFSVQNGE